MALVGSGSWVRRRGLASSSSSAEEHDDDEQDEGDDGSEPGSISIAAGEWLAPTRARANSNRTGGECARGGLHADAPVGASRRWEQWPEGNQGGRRGGARRQA